LIGRVFLLKWSHPRLSTGSLTANLIGFLGPIPALLEEELRTQGFVPNRDQIGYAGVEASMQSLLSGKNGTRVIQIDVAGQGTPQSGTTGCARRW